MGRKIGVGFIDWVGPEGWAEVWGRAKKLTLQIKCPKSVSESISIGRFSSKIQR
jgi:hypothetical protein